MKALLLHPGTKKQLETLITRQPHAVMITGAQGSGKKTIALHAACSVLRRQSLANYPYFLQILPIDHSIGIDAIRQIKTFLGKKTKGNSDIRRIVLIADAQTMTTEAQNALLKVLEEPPADTMMMLTASNINALRPTIVSRVQQMVILPVAKKAAVDALGSQGYSEQAITSAYHMSGGQAGLLVALLDQKNGHEVASAINTAKEFLRMDTYERLLQADNLAKQKEQVGLFIQGLQRVAASGLEQAAIKNNRAQVKKFHSLSSHLQTAQAALQQNASTKLVLINLFLQM